MSPIKWLRNKLDKKLRASLDLSTGNTLRCTQIHDGKIFYRVKLRIAGYFCKVIPIYHFEDTNHHSFSLERQVAEPLRQAVNSLESMVGNIPQAVLKKSVEDTKRRFDAGVTAIRDDTVKSIVPAYDAFHEKFLAAVLKKSQIDLRKKMAEVIKTTASEALANSIQKHLAMLLVKMRDEEQSRSGQNNFSSGSDALPSNCKFAFHRDGASMFVIEQAPQVRTISYLKKTFQIALPYVVFTATFNRNGDFAYLQVFFKTTPLRNVSDELLCPALPNIGETAYMACFPSPNSKGATRSQLVEEAIQNYWGSNFNNDLRAFHRSASSRFSQLETFDVWQKHSKHDPRFVLGLAWQSANTDVLRNSDTMFNIINGKTSSGASSIEALSEYANVLGERFSKDVIEKLHFMAEHSHVDVDSLGDANAQLKNLIVGTAETLGTRIDELLSSKVGDNEIDEISAELKKVLEMNIASVSRDMGGVISRVNQLQQQ